MASARQGIINPAIKSGDTILKANRKKLQSLAPSVQTITTAVAAPLPQSLAFGNPLRGSRHERGYGYAWEKLRKLVIKRDGHQCQQCKREGRLTPGQDVDHIINKASGGDDSLVNLQYLCRACHIAKTAHESNANRLGL
jgi:hypothetical protein